MSWNTKDIKKWDYDKFPRGASIPARGNSEEYETGAWSIVHPKFIPEKCTQCMLCFIFCPDSSIVMEEGQVVGIDYKHCKGCGICPKECPKGALVMMSDTEREMQEGEMVCRREGENNG